MTVRTAETDADIARCFAVMRQLRPHLTDEAEFTARVRRQMARERWRLVFVEEDGVVAAVAGFRILECLHSGRTLYVDDLVTAEDRRGRGHGERLMAYMEQSARDEGCETFSLDSGTQRSGAHKFYFRQGLAVTSFHFARKL